MIPLFSWGNDIILKGKTNPTFFFYNLNFLVLLYKNSIITTHMLLTKILESCMYSKPSSTCPTCRESTFKYSTVIASIIKYIFKENHAKWWWQSIVLNSWLLLLKKVPPPLVPSSWEVFDFGIGWFILLLSFYFFYLTLFNLRLLCVFIRSETLLLWKYKIGKANPH